MTPELWVALMAGGAGTALVALVTSVLRWWEERRRAPQVAAAEKVKEAKVQLSQEAAIRDATQLMSDKLFARLDEDNKDVRERLRASETEFTAFKAATQTRLDGLNKENSTLREENNQLRSDNGRYAERIEAQGKRITVLEQQIEGLKAEQQIFLDDYRSNNRPLPAALYERKPGTGPLGKGG